MDETLRLSKELWASKGYEVVNRINRFERSLRIFTGNYNDLGISIQAHVNKPAIIDIRDEQKQTQSRNEIFEVLRHLHNTVAAARSLVDHSRVFYEQHYEQHNLIPEYRPQIANRFKGDEVVQFVHCLRNFFQHYRSPAITSWLTIDNDHGNHVRSVRLVKSELEDFSNWSSPARTFIEKNTEDLDLTSIMKDYLHKVNNFHKWFHQQLIDVHKSDLDQYNSLVTAIECLRAKTPFYKNYRPR